MQRSYPVGWGGGGRERGDNHGPCHLATRVRSSSYGGQACQACFDGLITRREPPLGSEPEARARLHRGVG